MMSASDVAKQSEASLNELTPINVIRTETVLSRLPIHNLAKTGKVDINIVRKNGQGLVELQWEVSYNSKYGQPRQLAYKLDTVVVNRRIDDEKRPVPKVLKLGSLNHMCSDLGLNTSGKNMVNLKRAILQNAGTMITAKLSYRAADGAERRLEAAFARYSVIFTGERLPTGAKADGVYLVFNEPYWEVLNNAPVRPLDYDYLKRLTPAPQRFYEILSYRMFAAMRNKYATARLSYAEYATYSAQTRYFDVQHFKKQMYKVHRPHLVSGYILKVTYEEALDGNGQKDWIMHYVPGPKAFTEYQVFQGRSSGSAEGTESAEGAATPSPVTDPKTGLVDELIYRGVSWTQARKLADEIGDVELALDQIEWADQLIRQASPTRFYNPPGFYVYALRNRILAPPSFETRRQRLIRERAQAEHDRTTLQRLELESAYKEYARQRVEAYVAEPAHAAEFERLVEAKKKDLCRRFQSLALAGQEIVDGSARRSVLADLQQDVQMLSFDEYCSSVVLSCRENSKPVVD